jgi:hypothetical protein
MDIVRVAEYHRVRAFMDVAACCQGAGSALVEIHKRRIRLRAEIRERFRMLPQVRAGGGIGHGDKALDVPMCWGFYGLITARLSSFPHKSYPSKTAMFQASHQGSPSVCDSIQASHEKKSKKLQKAACNVQKHGLNESICYAT